MKAKINMLLGRGFKGLVFLELICVMALVNACSQQDNIKRKHDVDDLNAYVRMQQDSLDSYAGRSWEELNSDFEKKKVGLDKQLDKMDEETRKSYNNAITDWNSFKSEYTRRREEHSKVAQMDNLRATLVMEGVRPDYTDLGAKDVVKEYIHFVDAVKANKDTYTKEQWTAVNVNYKALNGRKRELEKLIPAHDMSTILKLQLEYVGVKALNRPFADNP